MNVEPLTPPIKWAGGKRWLVPTLQPIFAAYAKRLSKRLHSPPTRIVEPFCGACAVTLGLRPARALLNDLNVDLINFWQTIQQGLPLESVGGNSKTAFLRARKEFNARKGPGNSRDVRRASLFYYLNRTCFNGLWRVNKDGEFNVPFGKYNTITYHNSFPEIAKLIYQFRSGDYSTLAPEINNADFLYADPPYDSEFTEFTAGGFGYVDQVRLANWLAKQPAMVVTSNSATPRIVKLYKELDFEVRYIKAPRRISRDGKSRDDVREMLAIKKAKR